MTVTTPTAPRLSRDPFCRYRPARVVWEEFVGWWHRNHFGEPLPSIHNLSALTGLSRQQLYRLGVTVDFVRNGRQDF